MGVCMHILNQKGNPVEVQGKQTFIHETRCQGELGAVFRWSTLVPKRRAVRQVQVCLFYIIIETIQNIMGYILFSIRLSVICLHICFPNDSGKFELFKFAKVDILQMI